MTKLKNPFFFYKTGQNSNCDKTQKLFKYKKSKTHIMTKLENSNSDVLKTQI